MTPAYPPTHTHTHTPGYKLTETTGDNVRNKKSVKDVEVWQKRGNDGVEAATGHKSCLRADTHTRTHTAVLSGVMRSWTHTRTHKKLLQNFSSQSHLHRDEPHFPPRLWSPAWLSTASGPWDPSLEHEDVINKKKGGKNELEEFKGKKKTGQLFIFRHSLSAHCPHTERQTAGNKRDAEQ